MRKITEKWLKAATSLMITGLILFAGVMTVYHWDFGKLSTVKHQIKTYEIGEAFQHITIRTDADITLKKSTDGNCKVVCDQPEKIEYSVTVKDDTLTVKATDHRKWYDYINIDFQPQTVTVFLPEGAYTSLTLKSHTGDIKIPADFTFQNADISLSTGDVDYAADTLETVKIHTTTGDIDLKNCAAGDLDFSVTTGDITVSDVRCNRILSDSSTGDITIKKVIATNKITVKCTTGDVRLFDTDAAELSVRTTTGDVTGTLLTPKVFITETDTGEIKVPQTTSGGRCEITTSTGDIRFKEK